MTHKALRGLRVSLAVLLLLATGSVQTGGLDLLVQPIRDVGARKWINLVAGSLASAPVSQRLAQALPHQLISSARS
jgi:hypothetical protein